MKEINVFMDTNMDRIAIDRKMFTLYIFVERYISYGTADIFSAVKGYRIHKLFVSTGTVSRFQNVQLFFYMFYVALKRPEL